MNRVPLNKSWGCKETEYIGAVQCGHETWSAFDCTHFVERCGERIDECVSDEDARFKGQTIFAELFSAVMANADFRTYAKAKAWNLDRERMEWVKARFQFRDQINHLAFIFEMRFDLHEAYLVTVMNPDGRKDVAVKSGVVSYDILPLAACGTTIVVMRDWLDATCRVVSRETIDACDILWAGSGEICG
jgi:hypothetical protein